MGSPIFPTHAEGSAERSGLGRGSRSSSGEVARRGPSTGQPRRGSGRPATNWRACSPVPGVGPVISGLREPWLVILLRPAVCRLVCMPMEAAKKIGRPEAHGGKARSEAAAISSTLGDAGGRLDDDLEGEWAFLRPSAAALGRR